MRWLERRASDCNASERWQVRTECPGSAGPAVGCALIVDMLSLRVLPLSASWFPGSIRPSQLESLTL